MECSVPHLPAGRQWLLLSGSLGRRSCCGGRGARGTIGHGQALSRVLGYRGQSDSLGEAPLPWLPPRGGYRGVGDGQGGQHPGLWRREGGQARGAGGPPAIDSGEFGGWGTVGGGVAGPGLLQGISRHSLAVHGGVSPGGAGEGAGGLRWGARAGLQYAQHRRAGGRQRGQVHTQPV